MPPPMNATRHQHDHSIHAPSFLRALKLALSGAGLALCLGALPGHASAAPGVPAPPVVVWSEDFENLPAPTSSMDGTDLLLYVGLNPVGQKYTADPLWRMDAKHCNGIIATFNANPTSAAMAKACVERRHWNGLQQMAEVAGLFAGRTASDARKNHAMAMLTVGGSYPVNSTTFRTASNIPLPPGADRRFFSGSIDVVATFCDGDYVHPALRFSLVNDSGVALPLSATPMDPCQGGSRYSTSAIGDAISRTAVAQTVTSPGALLFSGSSVGFMLHNDQTSETGNDAAIDNVRILDVTPQLDKAFTPANITQLQTARLTLTITNTTDLLAKNGWSFTDSLPPGLTVAGNAGTTCAAGTVVDAAPDSTRVTVTQGNLAQGAASCEVSVDVRPAGPGSFSNGAGNLTLAGLNPPAAPAVLEVTPVADMQATDVGLPREMTVGIEVNGQFACMNAGPSAAVGASCELTGLPPGALTSCTPTSPTTLPLEKDARIECTVKFTPTSTGAVTAMLIAGSSTPDPLPTNNRRAHPYDPTQPQADMQAMAASLPTDMTVGRPVTGSYSCKNAGLEAAAMATCAITGLPAGASISCTPHTPTAAPLASGDSISCSVAFTPAKAGSLSVTVTAGSATQDPLPANNTWNGIHTLVEPVADMQATEVAFPSTVGAGTPVTGTFTCRNAGPGDATAATCAITGLPLGVHASCTPATPTGTPLASGAEISCSVAFTPATSDPLSLVITAGSSSSDPVPTNNSLTHAMNAALQPPQAIPATGTPALVALSLAVLLAGLRLRRRPR